MSSMQPSTDVSVPAQVVARYGYLDKVDHRQDFLRSILDKVSCWPVKLLAFQA